MSDSDLRDGEWEREGHGVDLSVASDHVVVDEFFHDFLLEAFAMHHVDESMLSFGLWGECDEHAKGEDETEDDDRCPHGVGRR